MKLLVDDQALETNAETAAHAVKEGVEFASASGRVVTSILLDGEPVDDVELLGSRVEGVLAIETQPPAELTAETAKQAIAVLEETREVQAKAVEHLDRGERSEALELLAQAFDSWQAARQTFEYGGALVGIDLTSFQASTQRGVVEAPAAISALTQALEDVRSAIENNDDSTLSDVLAGDLEACAGDWQALLGMLASVAEA